MVRACKSLRMATLTSIASAIWQRSVGVEARLGCAVREPMDAEPASIERDNGHDRKSTHTDRPC
jgi:hypothetical protein